MRKLLLFLCFFLLAEVSAFSQIIIPFAKRYETTQRGGLVLVANSMLTCNGGGGCATAQNEVPPAGTGIDNNFTSAYIDVDGDATTFSSSKADLNLPACSKITFAGLYWGAAIDIGNPKYAQRGQIKIKEPGASSYTTITSDTLYDFSISYNVYNCFADITSIVAAAGNGTYTLADLVSITGGTNQWAGWGIVVAYKNDLMQEKNITVFDGDANVNSSGTTVTLNVSGFYTPPAGAVNFELGEITYDGDRSLTGDSLLFNGAGSYVPVSDALHPVNDMFNSTICNNAVQTLTRNPAYKNTLGFDANVFKPNNAAKNYLANGASSSQIKVTTGGETILLQVLTSVIDTYEPELKMQKTVADVNGGAVNPGDTLLYTITTTNSGSDTSVATTITDTLPFNADFVPGSMTITSGPNAGVKTDAIGDDQADFTTSSNYQILKIRLGNGSDGTNGGQIPHVGANSSIGVTFKVRITDDCVKLLCNPTISNRAGIDYKGFISGYPRKGSSNPLLFDTLGCPIEGYTSTSLSVPVSCTPPPDSTMTACLPLVFSTVPGIRPNYAYYNSAWASVTQANTPGTYYGVRTVNGTSCKDTIKYIVSLLIPSVANAGPDQNLCNVVSTNMAGNTPVNGTGTWSTASGPNTPAFAFPHSPTSIVAGMIPGTYKFRWVISIGCDSTADTVTVVNSPLPSISTAGPDQNLCNVNSATLAGNNPTFGTGSWSFISGPNTPTITTPSNRNTTVTGMIPGIYTFRWTISNGVCTPSTDDVQITIYALPTVSNAGADQNLCNVTTASLSGNAPAVGTGTWTLVSGPNAPVITAPGSSNTSVTGMIAGVYIFRWTIANGVCASSTDDVQITIYALPTVSNAGPDQNLCNVTGTTLAANTAAVGAGTWSLVSGPNAPAITAPGNPSSTVTGMIAGVYTFRWTIVNGACASSTDDVQITIYALPTVSNAGPDQSLCNVASTAFAGNAPVVGSGNWTLISGPNTPSITLSTNPVSTITGMVPGIYIFRWTISNGVCTPSTDDVQIIIYALPTASNAGSDQNLCNVTTASLSGNAPAVGTGTWTLVSGPNAPVITAPGSSNTSVTGMIAGVYIFRWTIANGVCASSTDDVQITIYALPTVSNAGPDQNLCNVTGTTLAANTAAVGAGTWSLVSGPNAPAITAPGNPSSTVTGMIAGVYTFRWTIVNGACASSTDDVQITIYAPPTVSNAGPDQSLCNVTSTAFAGNAPVVGSGNWSQISGPNTPTITLTSDPVSTITGMVPGVYIFRWTITSGVCATSTDDVLITIYALPTVSNAGADQNLCNVTTASLSGNAPAVGTGTWTLVSGPNAPVITAPGSSNTSVTGMIAGVYIFRWTISNGVCAASTDDIQITIYDLPTVANAGPDQSVCNVASVTLAGNTPAVGTGNWTWISGPNTPVITLPINPSSTVTGMIPGVYVFRWTISNGVCAASSNDVQITIFSLPDVANAGPDQNLCNVTTTAFAGNTPSIGTGIWTLLSGPNTPTIVTSSSPTSGITGLVAGVYTFRWSIVNGVCAPSTDDVQITIYALPTVSNAGPDQNLCNAASAVLAGNTALIGMGNWTMVSGPNVPSITTPSSPSSSITGMIPGIYVFRWTITSGVCAVSSDDMQITNFALPTVSNAGGDQLLCNMSATTLNGNAPAAGSGLWTFISGPNLPTITAPSNPFSTVTGMISGIYIFRWTITNGVCAPSTDDIQVTVFTPPTIANAGPDQNLCNVTSSTLSGNAPVVGSGSWTLVSGPNTPSITAPSNPSSGVTGMIAGVYDFRWTISNGICPTTTDDVQITIYNLPTVANAGADQSLCNVTLTTLAGNAPAIGTGNWTLVSGPNTPSITTPSNPLSTVTGMIAGSYVFRWTISNGVCAVSSDSVQITIYELPTVSNAGPNQDVCNVTSVSLSANTPVFGSGSWTLVSGPNTPTFTSSTNPASSVTGMIAGVYVFRWTITNGVCAPSFSDVTVTIYGLPTIVDAGPDQNLCNVTAAAMAANVPGIGTGTWTVISGPNSPAFSSVNDPFATVTGMLTGTYQFGWTIANGVCTSFTDTVAVTIYDLPTVSSAGPNQDVCSVTSVSLSGDVPSIGTGNWTLVSGPNTPTIISPDSATTSVTGMMTGVYIFRWTISNGVCAPSSSDVQVTIYNIPLFIDAGPDQSICNASSATMAGNVPAVGTGTWMLLNGPNVPSITNVNDPSTTVTGMVAGTYLFGWSIANGVCVSPTDTVVITIFDLPTVANAGPDQNLCNVTGTTMSANHATTGTGTWSMVSGPNVPLMTDTLSEISTVTGLIAGTYTFVWTISNGVCSPTSDTVTITIYDLPTVANAGPDQSLCNADSAAMAGNFVVTGSGNWALVSGPNVPVITNPADSSTTITGLVPGVYTFAWSIVNGVCSITSDTVQITMYALPTLSNAGIDQSLCNVSSATLNGNTAFTGSGMWSLVSGPNVPMLAVPSLETTPVSGLVQGVYQLVWTISNGVCVNSNDTVLISVYDLPTVASAGPDQNLCSASVVTLSGNAAFSGQGLWTMNSGPNSPTINFPSDSNTTVSGLVTGTYVFNWSISNGTCAASNDSVAITIFQFPPFVDAGPDQILCNVTDVSLSGNNPSAGTGTWSLVSGPNVPSINSPNSPSTIVNGMVAGTYLFSWSIVNGSCSAYADTVQIVIYDTPTVADAGLDQSLCNTTSINLAGSNPVIGSGTWSMISGPNVPTITDSSSAATSVTGMIQGTYQFNWTISNGVCSVSTDTIQISIFNIPLTSNAGPDQDLCNTDSTILAGSDALTGIGTWSLISGPNPPVITSPNDSITSVTGMVAGIYVFGWTINNGVCITPMDQVTIRVYDLPTVADAGPDQVLCNDTLILLSGNAPLTGNGTWTFVSGPGIPVIVSPNTASTSVQNIVPGTYTFYWTISNGVCTSSMDSVQITMYQLPTVANAGPDMDICNLDSIVMFGNAAMAGTGNWTLISGPNNPVISDSTNYSTTVTGLIPGTYLFAWTIYNGVCSSTTDTMQVNSYGLPTVADAGPDQDLCNGGTAVMAGSVPITGTGTWTMISGPNVPVIASPNSPITSITGMIHGLYVFSWSIANGSCLTSSDTVQIAMEDILAPADAGPDQQLCNTSFTLTTATLSGSIPSSGTGTWSLVSGPNIPFVFSPNSPNTLVTGLANGVYVFRWTIVNGVCAPTFDDVQVSVYNLPSIAYAGPDQALCNGDSTAMLADSSVNGTGLWTLIAGPNSPVFNMPNSPATTVTGLIPGVYQFGWTYTNGTCSSMTDTVDITIYDLPTVADAGPDRELCHDSAFSLAGNVPVHGTGSWSLVSGPSSVTFQSPSNYNCNVTGLVTGVYIFRWTISNGICDSTTDDVQVTVYDLPGQTNAGIDQVLCGDTSTFITGLLPSIGTGTWSVTSGPNVPAIACTSCATTLVTGLIRGTYTFVWTITNGICPAISDEVQVTRIDNPNTPDAGPDQSYCSRDSIGLSANLAFIGTGHWSMVSGTGNPSIAYADSSITPVTQLQAGTYIFRWTISNGTCEKSDDVQITLFPPPDVTTSPNHVHICVGQQATLTASGASLYSWSPSDYLSDTLIFNPVASPVKSITYVVTGYDLNGCKGTDSVVVDVCNNLDIPDGFTPDGDGVNDQLVIMGIENYPNNALHIYNRWGNLVFEKQRYDNSWEGVPNVGGIKLGTGKVPAGTYFYVLEFGNGDNDKSGYLIIKY